MDIQNVLDQVIEMAVFYGPKLLGALVVWIIGSWIIKMLSKGLMKILEASKMDETLRPFLAGLVNTGLKILLVISVMGMVGIQMTSFIAILGAAGLAVGMALSGTLQNFAGGVMILIFRPYKIGDYIDALGFAGTVKEIQIFNTILTTVDNKTIILPNGDISGSSFTNYSTEPTRRVDWTFGIGYGDDVDKAKQVLKKLADRDERILKDPEVFIAVSELADSSVNLTMRAWVNAADYWGVFFAMNENVYKSFSQVGLNIPFPQMDIHLIKDEEEE
ncbi:MAG: mechanosensitive ion channel [Spirochaetales bacterium]|nr:mechanosensitive ion channel [Spirochaetales bacterium]